MALFAAVRRPALLALVLAVVPRVEAALVIDHDGLSCVVAERFVRVQARLEPAASVARARTYFRAEGSAAWYFVEMTPSEGAFFATLPKPLKSLKKINYYVHAMATGLAEARTREYAPDVVTDAGVCDKKAAGGALAGVASIAVKGPAGAARVPFGFSGDGIAGAGTQTSEGAGSAVAAAHGGGGKTLLLIGGGAAVAGGIAIAAKGGSTGAQSSSGSPSASAPGGLTATWRGTGADGFSTTRTALGATCKSQADVTLVLTQVGGSLSGTCTAVTRSASPQGCDTIGGSDTGPVTGSTSGSGVTLSWSFRDKTWALSGTVSGNRMSGTLTGTSADGIDSWNGTWAVTR